MNLEIANKLYELRKQNGLSQEALAEKLGISRQSISKWERAESSPDTDNLISLAKLYNISLDELLLNNIGNAETEVHSENKTGEDKEEIENETQSDENPDQNTDENKDTDDTEEIPDVGHKFVNVKDGENIVHVGTKGVFVKDDEGNEVKVGLSGVYVNGEKKDVNFKNHFHWHKDPKSGDIVKVESRAYKAFLHFPYPILTVIIYLLLGFFNPAGMGWSVGWIVFLTIPLYYTIIEAIQKRNPHIFCYPVLVVIIFLFFGMTMSLWHPLWVLFLTIPLYYTAIEMFKK